MRNERGSEMKTPARSVCAYVKRVRNVSHARPLNMNSLWQYFREIINRMPAGIGRTSELGLLCLPFELSGAERGWFVASYFVVVGSIIMFCREKEMRVATLRHTFFACLLSQGFRGAYGACEENGPIWTAFQNEEIQNAKIAWFQSQESWKLDAKVHRQAANYTNIRSANATSLRSNGRRGNVEGDKVVVNFAGHVIPEFRYESEIVKRDGTNMVRLWIRKGEEYQDFQVWRRDANPAQQM
jgi:hypothetical protein